MLRAEPNPSARCEAIRFATPDSLDAYMNRAPRTVTPVSAHAAIEESFFLGLRLSRGINLDLLRAEFGLNALPFESVVVECLRDALLEKRNGHVYLTDHSRVISNEVFARFLLEETEVDG